MAGMMILRSIAARSAGGLTGSTIRSPLAGILPSLRTQVPLQCHQSIRSFVRRQEFGHKIKDNADTRKTVYDRVFEWGIVLGIILIFVDVNYVFVSCFPVRMVTAAHNAYDRTVTGFRRGIGVER